VIAFIQRGLAVNRPERAISCDAPSGLASSVSDSANETSDQIAAESSPPKAAAAGATPSAAPAADKNGKLSGFLKWSKPYRDIIAILGTLIVSISGGVAWVVAHFATRVEMHYLECRVTNNILTQLLPIHLGNIAGKIEWRTTQVKVLAQHGGGTPQSIATIVELTDQMNALTKEQAVAAQKLKQDIDDIVKQCLTDSPQVGKTQ
jgi:hypothetical protein